MNQLKFSDLDRSERARIEYPDIEELAESLYKQGFIHPLAINQSGKLIAGGRRSAALDFLYDNPDQYPYGSAEPSMQELLKDGVLQAGDHFTIKLTTSEDHLRELELIENVQRRNFTWQEEVIAIARIHRLKSREAVLAEDTWGQRETGRLLKLSLASVSYAVRLADKLSDNPDSPMWKASGVSDAIQMLATQAFDEANRQLVANAKSRATTLPDIKTIAGSDFFSTFKPTADEGDHVELTKACDTFYDTAPAGKSSSVSEQDKSEAIYLASQIVKRADCINFFKYLGKESVDHVVCDPPYGIDMKNLKQANTGQNDIERIAETHDVEDNEGNFKPWLQGCYDILKDKGFCVWWCDIVQFENIKKLAKEVGFKAQSWQLTWVKTSNCMNQRAEYNFTKNTEIAIVLRKGDARLVKAQASSVWSGALTPEDKAKFAKHPFIKPDPLWGWLLDAIALPGSVIADPFSGVGSSTLAMFSRGYQPVCCEISEDHYNQQVSNLSNLITQMSK